jgi:parallel beta-helix repeat protein
VLVLGLLGALQGWIAARRPVLSDLRTSLEFVVTSSKDHGPGSLREAIFDADTVSERARIVFRVPFVELSTPLPTLANPAGIVMEAPEEGVELRALGGLSGPVIEVNSRTTVLRRIRIVNASEQGILVRSSGFRLEDSTISGADVGLEAVQGATDLTVERSAFDGNRIGVRLSPQIVGITLQTNRFLNHKEAGLWVVGSDTDFRSGQTLAVKENSFQRNRYGAVVGNASAIIENNEFLNSSEAALLLIGQGARVQGNRIRGGKGVGVFADRSQGTVIENNELDHNQTIGVLVRYSRDAVVRNNRIYANGYGIAFVLGEARSPSAATDNSLLNQTFDGLIVIGDSPVLRRNQVVGNRQAGLRVLGFSPGTGNRVPSDPYLENNALRGNAFDNPVRGEYRTERAGDAK